MAWPTIDPTSPAGTDKVKFGDDQIRSLKQAVLDGLASISNCVSAGTTPALKTTVWNTAGRPTGTSLVDKVTGYNSDLGYEEYYDLGSTTWKSKAPILTSWTVSGRPASPYTGQYGFNSDLCIIERWNGSTWKRISGGNRQDIKTWLGTYSDAETYNPGWVLCDGVQRTHPEGGTYTPPDLRDKFLVASGTTYATGDTGGAATVTLDSTTIPAHRHRIAGSSLFSNNKGIGEASATAIAALAGSGSGTFYDTLGNGQQIVENTGSSGAHNNLPPYYALCYLYKL